MLVYSEVKTLQGLEYLLKSTFNNLLTISTFFLYWQGKTFKVFSSQPYSGVLPGYYQGFKNWRPSKAAQKFLVFEIWRFLIFFQKNLNIKNYQN